MTVLPATATCTACALQKGVIEESGTHKSLMEKGGLYAAMWALQQEEDEINEMGMRSLGIHPGDYADTVMVRRGVIRHFA